MKLPLQSKKFCAYLISELGWKFILLWLLYDLRSKFDHYSFVVIITLIIVSGFIQVGYILGQAALDKYVITAQNITEMTKPVKVVKSRKEENTDGQ
jgi:hypothetical protein